VRLIYGPGVVAYQPDEAIVLCLVKDGEVWIKDFIEHYFQKGFKHIVFLDNGSTDNTLAIAKQYPNITILQTDVSFKFNNILLRRYLVTRFGRGHWSLTVDIDELWDYPLSGRVGLKALLGYLRAQGANAMVAQMLDMFLPNLPSERRSLKEYDRYDISRIKKIGLRSWGDGIGFYAKKIINERISLFRGGIRHQTFGLSGIWLTKMPLLFLDGTIRPLAHQHFSNNAVIADISAVLLHYKFTHVFRDQVREAVKAKQYAADSSDYRVYARKLQQNPSLTITSDTVRTLISVDQLVEQNFLVVTDPYVKMAQE
jgi:glycosyltransferase involved in cell wall biosynthesis